MASAASSSTPRRCKVLIIGAGMAGLSAASHLVKNDMTDFVVLEARKRIGGRIVNIKIGKLNIFLILKSEIVFKHAILEIIHC